MKIMIKLFIINEKDPQSLFISTQQLRNDGYFDLITNFTVPLVCGNGATDKSV